MKTVFVILAGLILLSSCTGNKRGTPDARPAKSDSVAGTRGAEPVKNDTVTDADYSFDEAIAGTGAPQNIIDQLELFDVLYLSCDGKIHRGQILSGKKIAEDIRTIFRFMLAEGFVVEKAIPAVRYGWSDSLSMADNNSYSFCYRDITYSKHATGMAIDINPRFNPLRWKTGNRPSQPEGASSDSTVNGTLYPGHPVVNEFVRLGFRWGHSFSKFYDDHHFEKVVR
ncbi:MAG: M15 family metallopeptidase [Proteiniphilum sp.]|jgi:hypothetical protein|nr:M15 family metallopeptidase [Proteiniphilum sp.]